MTDVFPCQIAFNHLARRHRATQPVVAAGKAPELAMAAARIA